MPSTQASHSPNNPLGDRAFACGPISVHAQADTPLRDRVLAVLEAFDVDWNPPHRAVDISVDLVEETAARAKGAFLMCARMLVDPAPGGLVASTTSDVTADGILEASRDRWRLEVPAKSASDPQTLDDLEELIGLAITTGWRGAGWVPIHAAAVVKEGRCLTLCAPAGVGKSTLTAGLVSKGWRSLGDDKVLLRIGGDGPELAAVMHTFNLDPQTKRWLPEVGDLERVPRHSSWTNKRRVDVTSIWPEGTAMLARPTDLVAIQRDGDEPEIEITALPHSEVLPVLLRQAVIPTDPMVAHRLLSTIAPAAASMRGFRLRIGEGAFTDNANLVARLEDGIG